MKKRAFMRGLEILASHLEEYPFAAEHDVFYVGDFESSYAELSPEERAEMESLGWRASAYRGLTPEESGNPPLAKGCGAWRVFM